MSEQGIPAQGIDVAAHVRVNTLQPLQLTELNRLCWLSPTSQGGLKGQ